MLSKRMEPLLEKSKLPVESHMKCMQDPFHPETNPDGYINFGTAENHLLWDRLRDKVHQAPPITESDSHYQMIYGKTDFRESIARLLSKRAKREISAESIVTAAGAMGVLEILAFLLCDPGDGVLVPAPYYPGFEFAFHRRANARLIPVPTHSTDQFILQTGTIRPTLDVSRQSGIMVQLLRITTPHNPLGIVYSQSQLKELADFCEAENLQLVVDEIYAESYFPGTDFTSALTLNRPYIHTVYGFAKDFGLSGLYSGVLHSDNEVLIKAARKIAHFHRVSNPVQSLLRYLLDDGEMINALFETNRQRIFNAYRIVTGGLESAGIPYVDAQGGIFVFLDLGRYLDSPTLEAEYKLKQRIFDNCKVNIIPGDSFACGEPGWFRLCYATHDETVRTGIKRLMDFLTQGDK